MSQLTQSRTAARFGLLQIAITILAAATALIHLSRGLLIGPPHLSLFPLVFYLNFLGYIVLIVALYLPQLLAYQRVIRWTLLVYAVITILAWIFFTHARPNLIGYIDKPIELCLIVLLFVEDRRNSLSRG